MIDVHDLSHHSRQCLRFALLVIVGESFVITSAYFLARSATTTGGLGVRGPASTAMAGTSLPSESRMNEAYGRLPLSFETNRKGGLGLTSLAREPSLTVGPAPGGMHRS